MGKRGRKPKQTQPAPIIKESQSSYHCSDQDYMSSDNEELYYESQSDHKTKKHKKISKQKQTKNGLSLLELTPKLMNLFHQSQNKIINLNEAHRQLRVQKRRIYDITNSLQALNMLRKTDKSQVQLLQIDEKNPQKLDELNEKVEVARKQLETLKAKVKTLGMEKQERFSIYFQNDN